MYQQLCPGRSHASQSAQTKTQSPAQAHPCVAIAGTSQVQHEWWHQRSRPEQLGTMLSRITQKVRMPEQKLLREN